MSIFEQRVQNALKMTFGYLTGEELTEPRQCNATLFTIAHRIAEIARDEGMDAHLSTPTLTDKWQNPHDSKPAKYSVQVSFAGVNFTTVQILPRVAQ